MRSAGWHIVFLFAVSVGCASGPTPFGERPKVKGALPRIKEPFPYKVAVFKQKTGGKDPYKALDASRVALGMLKETKLFESVTLLEGRNIASALAEARRRGIDILITGNTSFGGVTYNGHTGWRIPKVVIWAISEFLSALIADELYTVEAEATLSLYSVYSRSVVERVSASTRTQVVLNDYQRGFKLWGIWRVPSSLHKGNFDKIKKTAAENIEEDLKEALFFRLLETLEPVRLARLVGRPEKTVKKPPKKKPSPKKEPKKEKSYKVVLLAVGYNDRRVPFAERSASSFAVRTKILLGKGAYIIKALLGWNARLAMIESAVKQMKIKKAETVVLYLASFAVADDNIKVKLADGYHILDELVKRLRGLKPERIVVFCDIYAEKGGSWRYSTGRDTLALFARRPGERCLLKGKVTLFCAMLDSILHLADSNNDGVVSPKELSCTVSVWMRRQSRLLKLKGYQTPTVVGSAEIPLAGR